MVEQNQYYQIVRSDLFPYIPDTTDSILDLGCGAGATIKALKERGCPYVVGIEIEQEQRTEAKKYADAVLNIDLNLIGFKDPDYLTRGLERQFDVVLMGDIVEHLPFPTLLLNGLHNVLSEDGIIVASIPNIGWICAVLQIWNQSFQYRLNGHFDAGHVRFYCREDIRTLFDCCGYEILKLESLHMTEDMPEYQENGVLTFGDLSWKNITQDHFTQLMTYQWVCVARKKES